MINPWSWLRLNLEIGALSVGGAGRTMLYEDAVVHRYHWVEEEEFRQIFTIAQVLPGPNLINLSLYLGYHLVGTTWALAGILALAIPGALAAVFVVAALDLSRPFYGPFLRGTSLGTLALFVVLIARLLPGLRAGDSRRRKVLVRATLAVAIGLASLGGFPIFSLIVGAIPICLAAEFLL